MTRIEGRPAQAYRLREAGAMWKHIAKRLGYAGPGPASASARKYAQSHGLPWPIPISIATRHRKSRSSRRTEEAYALRAAGHSWADIAEKLGYTSVGGAVVSTCEYARHRGLTWPPLDLPIPSATTDRATLMVAAALPTPLVRRLDRLSGGPRRGRASAIRAAIEAWVVEAERRERNAEIVRLLREGRCTQAEIARRYGVSNQLVSRIWAAHRDAEQDTSRQPDVKSSSTM